MPEKGKFDGMFTPEGANDQTEPIEGKPYDPQGAPSTEYKNPAMLEVGEHDSLQQQLGIEPEDV